mmetsp:Transcript_8954/g.21757  ORF Transcript_8954/g.21757 Transcript_8954/m.21757 type:complete len:88 (-) Transcript_8954:53-316(-)
MIALQYTNLCDLNGARGEERRDVESGLVRILMLMSAERMKWDVMNRINNGAMDGTTNEGGRPHGWYVKTSCFQLLCQKRTSPSHKLH